MELKITQETQNPLFKRKEIIATINSDITPSKSDVEKKLSEKFSTESENISIKNIKGKFGSKDFQIQASIYENPKDKNSTELKTKKQRDAEKKAFQEAPKEESKTDEQIPSTPEQSTSTSNQENSDINKNDNPEPSGEAIAK